MTLPFFSQGGTSLIINMIAVTLLVNIARRSYVSNFKKKALIKMEELIRGGATVIMASHRLEVIEKYCVIEGVRKPPGNIYVSAYGFKAVNEGRN